MPRRKKSGPKPIHWKTREKMRRLQCIQQALQEQEKDVNREMEENKVDRETEAKEVKMEMEELMCTEPFHQQNQQKQDPFHVDMAVVESIMNGQHNVFPTTPLEQWLIDQQTSDFELVQNWRITTKLYIRKSRVQWRNNRNWDKDDRTFADEQLYKTFFLNDIILFVAAFCRKTRRCICLDEQFELFVVDANELFTCNYTIDPTFSGQSLNRFGLETKNIVQFPFRNQMYSIDDLIDYVQEKEK